VHHHPNMKNPIKTFILAGTLAMLCSTPVALQAQDMLSDSASRSDGVGSDLQTLVGRRPTKSYDRVVLENRGAFDVVITDLVGQIRMTGSYLDTELLNENGLFTFYHPNGAVESRGMFDKGLKSGTWSRFQSDGTPKAERNYTGLSWEEVRLHSGGTFQETTP
nr:hypothetical protein [Bacteroidota bacterium]